jgi:triosephosphate isomerase (TIM)
MRTPVIAGNWKMFKTPHEGVAYIRELAALTKGVTTVELVVAPPFTAIHAVADAAHATAIEVSGQNLHWEREGAFTGEVSAQMLRAAGATWVIIGHSERRTLFGETNDTVNKKLMAAIAAQLRPIVCIGETLAQRDASETMAVLDRQIREGLDGITGEQLTSIVLAYEPVWAIGTGRTATPQQAGEAHAHIRQRLRQWFGVDAADRCRILYGGSVKPDNIAALVAEADVDGALVGGASLDARGFADIVKKAAR